MALDSELDDSVHTRWVFLESFQSTWADPGCSVEGTPILRDRMGWSQHIIQQKFPINKNEF